MTRVRGAVGMATAWTALAGLAVGATLLLVAEPWFVLLAIVEKGVFLMPGLLLVRAAAGPAAGWLPVVAFGPFIGFGLSSLTLLGLWAAGGRGSWTILAASLLVLPLVPFARRVQGRWALPTTLPGDRAAIAAAVLIVPLVVAAPFAHVGEQINVGKAYRAYFTADYVWRRAVVAELAKGDMLPVNPFYRDDPLRYYWLPHLSTAVTYRNVDVDLDEALLVHSTTVDVLFVAFLYGLARWFVPSPRAAAAGVASVILCSSYEGLYALWEHWSRGAPLSLVKYLNIDAMSRWRLQGMPIDGLQRVLFYQPHHAIGYGLGFLGILAVMGRRRRFDPMALAVGGTLLGLSTVLSSFAGLMLTAVAALWEACSVLRWREWWRATVHASAAALPLVLAAALVTSLEYVDHGGQIVSVGPNRLAFHRLWECTVLSFGPIIPIAALAAWAFFRARDGRALVFASLWVTCVFFYFMVDVRDHQDVYVGWRVGHLWFMGSIALAAGVYQWLAGLSTTPRLVVLVPLATALLAALPTTAIDVYNTQDIYNWAQGPGFPWTLIVSPEELETFAWIKAHTPAGAVFQVDPLARDVEGWAYLPAFAERRMGVGLPISMVPLHKYEEGSRRASWMFETGSAESAHTLAARNGIDYLVIGGPERKRHPRAEQRFESAPDLFELVFRNRAVSIYRVRGPGELSD